MPILIKQKSARRKGKESSRGRSFLALLAIAQLPITLGLIIFGWFLLTSFQNQGLCRLPKQTQLQKWKLKQLGLTY